MRDVSELGSWRCSCVYKCFDATASRTLGIEITVHLLQGFFWRVVLVDSRTYRGRPERLCDPNSHLVWCERACDVVKGLHDVIHTGEPDLLPIGLQETPYCFRVKQEVFDHRHGPTDYPVRIFR